MKKNLNGFGVRCHDNDGGDTAVKRLRGCTAADGVRAHISGDSNRTAQRMQGAQHSHLR